jgi:hypothetical protein
MVCTRLAERSGAVVRCVASTRTRDSAVRSMTWLSNCKDAGLAQCTSSSARTSGR